MLDGDGLVPRSEYEDPLTKLFDWVAQKALMQRFDVIHAGPMWVVLRAEELDGSGKSILVFRVKLNQNDLQRLNMCCCKDKKYSDEEARSHGGHSFVPPNLGLDPRYLNADKVLSG